MALKNVDTVFKNLCNILENQGKSEETRKLCTSFRNDEERVAFASKMLTETNLLPSASDYTDCSKDVTKSIELRNQGNKLFQKKSDSQALLLYTQSISFAPCPLLGSGSEGNDDFKNTSLALGFANRSAVLFSMGQYDECLDDIDQAFKCNYPNNLWYKLQERRGKCLRAKGKVKEAQDCFLEALKCLPAASSLTEEKKQLVEKELKRLLEQIQATEPLRDLPHIKQKQQPIPSKSHGQHKQITSTSDCVDIRYNPEMGRFIEATRDIRPGDVIVVEKPYASVLLPSSYKTHCCNCFQRHRALIPCYYCSTIMYCSEACRTESWEKNHHIECQLLSSLLTLEISKMGLLALRIVIVASSCGKNLIELYQKIKSYEVEPCADIRLQGFDDDGLYKSDNYSTIYHLVGNTEKRKIGDLFIRAVIAACLLNCVESKSEFFKIVKDNDNLKQIKAMIGGLLLRHLQNVPCNAHEVSEHIQTVTRKEKPAIECLEIGAAAYATLSLINHSCDPNVVRHCYQGDTVVLRAIQPIKNGEQIVDNYGYHYALHGRDERCSDLEGQYYFICECNACVLNWPMYQNLPNSNPHYKCLQCGTTLAKFQLNANLTECNITCNKCKNKNNIMDMRKQIVISSEKFQNNLKQLISGNECNVTNELIDHLELLHKRICNPWKEYNECQETLKHCYSMTGNYYVL